MRRALLRRDHDDIGVLAVDGEVLLLTRVPEGGVPLRAKRAHQPRDHGVVQARVLDAAAHGDPLRGVMMR